MKKEIVLKLFLELFVMRRNRRCCFRERARCELGSNGRMLHRGGMEVGRGDWLS